MEGCEIHWDPLTVKSKNFMLVSKLLTCVMEFNSSVLFLAGMEYVLGKFFASQISVYPPICISSLQLNIML